MIISISGKPGSGKSSVAKAIAKEFGLERYYMGRLWREKAREKGLTLVEGLIEGETDSVTDKEIDDYQIKLGQTKDDFVIEGRTSFHFIPQSYKIYLDVEPEEGAKRIWGDLQKNADKRNEAQQLNSVDDVIKSVARRIKSSQIRYRKYYNIDVFDPKNYDFYLDTTKIDKPGVIKKVIEQIKKDVVTRIKERN
ncbi:cytidylate kinase family protein [Patescibacteria group bacterium]|nr:cytidylate kinase family protein [Patescibacteria group bacterium]MBU1889864.1 cytidylate kinase family protein [Patescibacteria group bacterium]